MARHRRGDSVHNPVLLPRRRPAPVGTVRGRTVLHGRRATAAEHGRRDENLPRGRGCHVCRQPTGNVRAVGTSLEAVSRSSCRAGAEVFCAIYFKVSEF